MTARMIALLAMFWLPMVSRTIEDAPTTLASNSNPFATDAGTPGNAAPFGTTTVDELLADMDPFGDTTDDGSLGDMDPFADTTDGGSLSDIDPFGDTTDAGSLSDIDPFGDTTDAGSSGDMDPFGDTTDAGSLGDMDPFGDTTDAVVVRRYRPDKTTNNDRFPVELNRCAAEFPQLSESLDSNGELSVFCCR